jgi:hypothetical protein
MQTSRNRKSAPGRMNARVVAALVGLSAIVSLSARAAAAAPHHPVTHYVDCNAAGADDGTSWADAFTDLQSALDAAVAGDEIWVVAGTYTPSADDRSASFLLKSGVAVYGGFAGDEKQLKNRQQDPSLTVLSGDIGVVGDDTDNSYHVVYAEGVTDVVLDGFTVTGGRASGIDHDDAIGGGMLTINSAFSVSNCIFSDNAADRWGGGMYNRTSALTVSDCLFSGNRAGKDDQFYCPGRGGGMYNEASYGSTEESSVITGCTFRNNETRSLGSNQDIGYSGGAGLYNWNTSPTVDRCTFELNHAHGSGAVGGGMVNYYGWTTVSNSVFNGNNAFYAGSGVANVGRANILNCTFYRNGWWDIPGYYVTVSGSYGGAIYQYGGGSRVVGSIFSGNVTNGDGAAIYLKNGYFFPKYLTITKCLFHDNRGYSASGSEVRHFGPSAWTPEVDDSLFDVDPLLADPDNGDFHLLEGSPAIDAGVTRAYADLSWLPLPETDFEGDARFVDGDGFAGAAADIGADEYVPTLQELGDLIAELADAGQIDEELVTLLLGYVDDAQAAFDDGDAGAAKLILEDMIDWLKTLDDNDTTERILTKTEAVHGTFD